MRLVVVAVPVGEIAAVVTAALDAGAPLVTDVGSVKAPVVNAVEAARPDLAGALRRRSPDGRLRAGRSRRRDADLFVGRDLGAHADASAPTPTRSPPVRHARRAPLGAEAIAVTPELHDALVAVVSHVPQLAASTLMNVAGAQRRPSTPSCCGSLPAASAT